MSTIVKNAPFMELPLGISRQVGAPIERFEVFYDIEDAKTYAKDNPLAYVGQTIKIVSEDLKTVTVYNIGFDGSLNEAQAKVETATEEDITAIINKYLLGQGTEIPAEKLNKVITGVAIKLMSSEIVKLLAKKSDATHTHNADQIADGTTKTIPTKAKQSEWDSKVTNEQLQNAINQFASGLAWKGVYTNLAELKKAIPNPKEGDFVIVTQEPTYQNQNTLLIYEAESVNEWQTAGQLMLPGLATPEADGLMSKGDKKKLDGLQNYEHPASHPATMITEDDEHKFVTTTEKTNIATALNTANEAKEAAAIADGKVVAAQNTANTANATANTAKSTADSALSKANANEKSIDTANGKITALEEKFVYLTIEEAQGIIDKYKQA